MKRRIRIILLVLLSTSISGCASLVRSDVAVFHRLQDQGALSKYVFVPLEGQKGSLEYGTYQDLIRSELAKHNYVEISPGEVPDVVITFGYGIDSGEEKLSSVPLFGQTGVSSSHTYGTVNTYGNYGTYSGTTTYTPTYGIIGSKAVSRTEYSRELWLYIADAKSVGTENLNILYEGNVKSSPLCQYT